MSRTRPARDDACSALSAAALRVFRIAVVMGGASDWPSDWWSGRSNYRRYDSGEPTRRAAAALRGVLPAQDLAAWVAWAEEQRACWDEWVARTFPAARPWLRAKDMLYVESLARGMGGDSLSAVWRAVATRLKRHDPGRRHHPTPYTCRAELWLLRSVVITVVDDEQQRRVWYRQRRELPAAARGLLTRVDPLGLSSLGANVEVLHG